VLEVIEPSRKSARERLDSTAGRVQHHAAAQIALDGAVGRRAAPRVEIARALATRPNYMLLDEPFAGIDPIAVGDIQRRWCAI
jgi:lipopolysaccharide export system ATP-binding protein